MLKKIIVIFLLLSIFIGICSAVSMQVSPVSINPGDTVQIIYSDLLDGSSFSLLIKGKIDVSPNSDYTMNVNSFVIPISLSGGTVSANADNSLKLALNYESSDSTIKTITQYGDSSNLCSISESQSVSAKTYEKMWVEGVSSTGNIVNTEISFIGTKSGSDSGTISFKLSGFDHSTINIICMVDGTIVTNTPIYVGGGSVSTPIATTVTSVSASVTASKTSAPTPTATSGNIVAESSYPQTQPESAGNSESAVSVDGQFFYTGKGASNAIIMYDSYGSVPAGWNIEGQAYALISDGSDVDGKIGFIIPESYVSSGKTDKLFIAEYNDEKWLKLPSEIDVDIIESPVLREGTFVLVSKDDNIGENTAGLQEEGLPVFVIAIICVIIIGLIGTIYLKIKK